MKTNILAALILTLANQLAGCGEETTGTNESGEAVAVMQGKADDYLSPSSREYLLWGMGDVSLDAEEWLDKPVEEKEAYVREMLDYRFKAYAFFINEYITDKSSHDENKDYGGYAGLIRSASLDWVVDPVDDQKLVWAFIWEMEMGGPQNLLDVLPLEQNEAGENYFLVKLPKYTDDQLKTASFPKHFDPDEFEGDLEEIQVVVEPEDESIDAWPRYDAFFEDDLFDVLIVVGGDYNDKRYDLISAEDIFKWLKSAGYQHDAAAYTDLTLESPPFTRTFTANDREISIEVTLLHPDIVEDAKLDDLREVIIKGYETMDLILYDGHAGQDPGYSGVVYHYNPRHAIKANDFATLNLPQKYQLFVFNGCKTYNAYPGAVMKNSAKTTLNLDIISTVNFSWLSQQSFTTSGLLKELLAVKAGTHDPGTYVEVLSEINRANNWNVYYGVHGLDDNPHINPYADLTTLCEGCSYDSDCPGQGNRCVAYSWGRACGAECTANDGCPNGYMCGEIAAGGQIIGRQCMPTTMECSQ